MQPPRSVFTDNDLGILFRWRCHSAAGGVGKSANATRFCPCLRQGNKTPILSIGSASACNSVPYLPAPAVSVKRKVTNDVPTIRFL